MPIKYEYWARLATPGAKEHTFGQFHLIPRIDRFPSSKTHALCGKLGIVITPQADRPLWHQRCKNCVRMQQRPFAINQPKLTKAYKGYLIPVPGKKTTPPITET